MDRRQKHHSTKAAINKVFAGRASTAYGVCGKRLTEFGCLLALIKFLDLIGFEQVFEEAYRAPKRTPKSGHYRTVIGFIMLLFIGFNRLWHFVYIRLDSLVCGFYKFRHTAISQHLLALCGQLWHQTIHRSTERHAHSSQIRFWTRVPFVNSMP